ncbi:DNA photolyase [Russula emetica]|nr:DNA photolyase [Russula emetica]
MAIQPLAITRMKSLFLTMVKCARAATTSPSPPSKKLHLGSASSDTAAVADADPSIPICDNRALAQASARALKDHIPLVVFFTLSPQDYAAHDRSSRRIDFTLRNLSLLKNALVRLNIPLHVSLHSKRRTLPSHVISLLQSVNAIRLFANIEYEVDELRRDITVCNLAKDRGILPSLFHDKLIVQPGLLSTKQGKSYTDHSLFQKLFASEIPSHIEGFQCSDKDQMSVVWPAKTDVAREMLRRFLHRKSRDTHLGLADPLEEGAEASENRSRAMVYKENRDRRSGYNQSSKNVATLGLLGKKKAQADRDSGIGMWVQGIDKSSTSASRSSLTFFQLDVISTLMYSPPFRVSRWGVRPFQENVRAVATHGTRLRQNHHDDDDDFDL